MQTKTFELLDKGTFIPMIAVLMEPEEPGDLYLLRRSGYRLGDGFVMFCRMDADGSARQASADPYGWGVNRTYTPAHLYIQEHWGELKSGDVIDVEFLLGETKTKKQSERETQL